MEDLIMEKQADRVKKLVEDLAHGKDIEEKLVLDPDQRRIIPVSPHNNSYRRMNVKPRDLDVFSLKHTDAIIVVDDAIINTLKPRAQVSNLFRSMDHGTVFTLLENQFATEKVPGTIYINDGQDIKISGIGEKDDIVRVIVNRNNETAVDSRY
jgi:hypothetical protein